MLYYPMHTRHFVGLDPGGTTGFAALSFPPKHPPTFWVMQYTTGVAYAPDIAEIARQLSTLDPEVVIEDFHLVANANRGASATWGLQPVAVTAALQGFCLATHYPADGWFFQGPGQAKGFMPDHRLKAVHPQIELYTRGLPHARDAMRHVLAHLARKHPALYQAAKGATPDPTKYLQTPRKPRRVRHTRTRAC